MRRTSPATCGGGDSSGDSDAIRAQHVEVARAGTRTRTARRLNYERQRVETTRGSQRRSLLGEELERIFPGQVQPDLHHRREEGDLPENYRDEDDDNESKIEEQARQQGIELSKCVVSYSINNQSPDIADGVNVSKDDLDVDAGAQDMRVMRHTR